MDRHPMDRDPLFSKFQFIQNLVSTFEKQRKNHMYQFAVLFISPYQDINTDNGIFQITKMGESGDYEATDSDCPTFPPDQDLGNYITARPDQPDHAETLLLDRFRALWARNWQACRTILLYTWLLPCNNCTKEIIRILGPCTSICQVIVVYTSTMRYMPVAQQRENIRKLKAAGIAVKKEGYDKRLERK